MTLSHEEARALLVASYFDCTTDDEGPLATAFDKIREAYPEAEQEAQEFHGLNDTYGIRIEDALGGTQR